MAGDQANAKRAAGQDGSREIRLTAPSAEYRDEHGNVLTLRGSLTIGARQEYRRTRSGADARPGASMQDTEQRALELLFERLAERWEISGAPIERQRDLLLRFRAATPAERAFVRRALRKHCGESFPELQVP